MTRSKKKKTDLFGKFDDVLDAVLKPKKTGKEAFNPKSGKTKKKPKK